MRRYAAKVDANQPAIVGHLRDLGWWVECTHTVGGGFPDLICAKRGRFVPAEVKDGAKPPSARELTPDQEKWHAEVGRYGVEVEILTCLDDVLAMDRKYSR